ncbi:MAG: hypothetical protein KZQ83_01850 [gamma proteobacterium symbiont of Taylorina sp.]|nr:hypothetical protein [gamma proteobacterium symbiont of Taylorina sp.]
MDSQLLNREILSTEVEKLPASGLLLELKPNHWLLEIYLIFFMLVIVSLFLLPVSMWFTFILVIAASTYFQLIFRKYLLFNHPESIQKLVFTELEWCFIQLNNTQILKTVILSDTILSEHLVILNLKNRTKTSVFHGRYSILITAGSVGRHDFWKLKRYLRFKKLDS